LTFHINIDIGIEAMKPVEFLGDSLERLRAFPDRVRREAGYQLDRVQRGLEPDDWKPMSGVGPGIREIRLRDLSGAFRVIYVANFRDAVYVCMPSKRNPSGRRSATSRSHEDDFKN
jgi:phage-related protein